MEYVLLTELEHLYLVLEKMEKQFKLVESEISQEMKRAEDTFQEEL